MFELKHGDCLDVLRTMADNSIDAIVTDPPYGLSFMGKRWDYDVPDEAVWRECLRVLKPGGHLLAFAGTRTQHRMAVRIEDAGFEIRDMIAWVYGSGFPKSLDVSKAIDKCNGQPNRLHKFTAWMRTTGLTARQLDEITGTRMGSHYTTHPTQPAIPTAALWDLVRPHCGEVPAWVDELVQRIEAEREVVGQSTGGISTRKDLLNDKGTVWGAESSTFNITAPATPAAKEWAGWGTALKPALEPITVARKPLIGTVAENVLTWGTGGVNVDGCRVGTDKRTPYGGNPNGREIHADSWLKKHGHDSGYGPRRQDQSGMDPNIGRWPANLIHDGSEEVVGLFPSPHGAGSAQPPQWKWANQANKIYGKGVGSGPNAARHGDSGSAARFFYCAKASKRDRDEGCEGMPSTVQQSVAHGERQYGTLPYTGEQREIKPRPRTNAHPTVKPTDLMRYLCRLVTPPNGTVLDPFMGSGSTGKGAILEGFNFIGIEREAEYLDIARARIEHVTKEPNLWQS